MRKLFAVISFAGSALLPIVAHAQFAKPEDAIAYRQSTMTLMGAHSGRMAAMIRGQQPFDAATFQANADLVKTLAKLSWPAFGPGLQGGKTKPEAWSDSAKFKEAADRFQDAADKLAAAAQSGDQTRIRAAFGDVGASCKACHDDYRAR